MIARTLELALQLALRSAARLVALLALAGVATALVVFVPVHPFVQMMLIGIVVALYIAGAVDAAWRVAGVVDVAERGRRDGRAWLMYVARGVSQCAIAGAAGLVALLGVSNLSASHPIVAFVLIFPAGVVCLIAAAVGLVALVEVAAGDEAWHPARASIAVRGGGAAAIGAFVVAMSLALLTSLPLVFASMLVGAVVPGPIGFALALVAPASLLGCVAVALRLSMGPITVRTTDSARMPGPSIAQLLGTDVEAQGAVLATWRVELAAGETWGAWVATAEGSTGVISVLVDGEPAALVQLALCTTAGGWYGAAGAPDERGAVPVIFAPEATYVHVASRSTIALALQIVVRRDVSQTSDEVGAPSLQTTSRT